MQEPTEWQDWLKGISKIENKKKKIMLRLYKSLVRPHVEYCSSAWSPHYKKDKLQIEKVQRRFTKIIPELREFDYETRLRKLNLWSLEERRNRADIIEVFKMLNEFSAVPFETFFQLDWNNRTRGHTAKIMREKNDAELS